MMANRDTALRVGSLRLLCSVAVLGLALAGASSAATGKAAKGAKAPASKAMSNVAARPEDRLYNGPELPAGHDLTGVWQLSAYDPQLKPVDGGAVPFTAEGKKQFAANAKAKTKEPGKNGCQPLGTPRAYVSPFPVMFVQVPANLITIFHEENRSYRFIRLDAGHFDPRPWDPSFVGESIGKWDGDTLTVDTTNFNAMTWLDDAGTPVSDQLHVVEHWKKTDGGRRLQVDFTIEDPTIFTHPWTAKRVYDARPDVYFQDDWVCGEPHRSLTGIKGVEKLYEKKDKAK